jgi:protein-S-isoprenylcysteine O-methyltransferase Ste14
VLSRSVAVVVGLAAHLLLAVTVWFLFPFMMGGREPDSSAVDPYWYFIDLALVVQFSLPHSLLLRPGVRNRLQAAVPGPIYGCFYTLVTCSSLLLLIGAWRVCPVVWLNLNGLVGATVRSAYVLSWGALLYTLALTGFGNQTGWTPLWSWLRHGEVPRRPFQIRGAYHWMRHPVYLAFLGQVWLTPLWTPDRVLLSLTFTGYIFLGSYFKDRRMQFYLGDVYRAYQAEVPGYPLVPGPLGRVHAHAA